LDVKKPLKKPIKPNVKYITYYADTLEGPRRLMVRAYGSELTRPSKKRAVDWEVSDESKSPRLS